MKLTNTSYISLNNTRVLCVCPGGASGLQVALLSTQTELQELRVQLEQQAAGQVTTTT